jgi:hypothetical protein
MIRLLSGYYPAADRRSDEAQTRARDGNHDRFRLKQSAADRLRPTPLATAPTFRDALLRLLDDERIDLVIPPGDGDVLALSALRRRLGIAVLPSG